MIFYLGEEIKTVEEKIRLAKNKAKSWSYGYDPTIDTVIISKDGTLGKVFNVMGLNIGMPEPPKKNEIINSNKSVANQKWVREPLPIGLNEDNWKTSKYSEYIDKQFEYRDKGCWIYIKGELVYLTGTYWFFIQWYREEAEYPRLRIIQNELMIYWEACKADQRCYGMDYVKNRRFGASALGNNELLESGTIYENKELGIISKKGADAKKIFNRLVRSFKRLPPFFKPETDGTNTPKTELVLTEQTKKRKQGESVTEGDGLDTNIKWHNTEMNAMDGDKIFRSLIDEAGKWLEVPFSTYWSIVKTSHRLGSNIVGKAMVVSTVNAMKKGGSEFYKIWKDSNPTERNANGQTKSGLYRIFIPARYSLEGFFDEYGFCIVEDPKTPIKNDLGNVINIGAITYLKNEEESLKDDPEKLNEFKRQFPDTERDAFRDEANDCDFNLINIQEQIEHNNEELNENEHGNDIVTRGNLFWKDGIPDTEVYWKPDPNGRFWISHHPIPGMRNQKIIRTIHGITAFAPINSEIGCIGVDPYNRSKTVDGRGSKGSIHLATSYNTSDLPNNAFIVEYIDRPRTVEDFYEDVIKLMVYYSIPILPELSSEKFSQFLVDRGYRHFIKNNPFKKWKDLSDTEKQYGGIPPQDAKVGDQQFYAVESYIEEYVGVARDNSNRPIGEMGFMPFTRTLIQWKDVDTTKRTKFDAYISSSLALLGNQRRVIKPLEKPKEKKKIVIQTYDNSGLISKAI